MAPKKQSTTGEGTISKGKSVATAEDIVSANGRNLNPIVEDIVSEPSQGVAEDIHPPLTYEAQLL